MRFLAGCALAMSLAGCGAFAPPADGTARHPRPGPNPGDPGRDERMMSRFDLMSVGKQPLPCLIDSLGRQEQNDGPRPPTTQRPRPHSLQGAAVAAPRPSGVIAPEASLTARKTLVPVSGPAPRGAYHFDPAASRPGPKQAPE